MVPESAGGFGGTDTHNLGLQMIPSHFCFDRKISPRKHTDTPWIYFGQISPELLFVTLGTQTETGCIFNEVVSGWHCETKPDTLRPFPLSFSLLLLRCKHFCMESDEPRQRTDFPRVSINGSLQMRPKC